MSFLNMMNVNMSRETEHVEVKYEKIHFSMSNRSLTIQTNIGCLTSDSAISEIGTGSFVMKNISMVGIDFHK